MRFESLESLVRAYETDELRFTYPLVYWRLPQVAEEIFQQ